jgi:hypothetical protein
MILLFYNHITLDILCASLRQRYCTAIAYEIPSAFPDIGEKERNEIALRGYRPSMFSPARANSKSNAAVY